ncbi:MAG: hypothetical protein IK094_04765 [Treponema sp.]|nr:hypothetical protein [Treponema sp.]
MPGPQRIVRRLDALLKDERGEEIFFLLKKSFSSKNPDVEHFLKNSAVQSMKLHQSSTYLVMSPDFDLVGYFTLALKVLRVDASLLSNKESSKLQRFSLPDKVNNSFIVPAILIAQFSKNRKAGLSTIAGKELMSITLDYVRSIQSQVGGLITFLECEPIEKLVEFYKSQGFRMLSQKIITKADKELLQMYRLI